MCLNRVFTALFSAASSSSSAIKFPPLPPPCCVSRTHPISLPFPSLPFYSSPHPLWFPFSLCSQERATMSSQRTRITEEEIRELISKLHAVLPETRRRGSSRASAAKLLQDTCNYIKSLHREVDDLSERLSELISTMDMDSAQAEILRGLLRS